MGPDNSGIGNEIQLDDFQKDLAQQVLEQLDEYGQSGLEVMTSGGKSFIAAHVMYEYVNKHHNTMILWMAPKAAINNVKNKIFKSKAIGNRIVYVGYEELARGNFKQDTLNGDDIGLIVFDECHKALAKQTYKHLEELLDILDEADRLAMSATPVRYGGLDTFSILVPKVEEPIRFDLSDAGNHGLLPDLQYIVGNTNVCPADISAIQQYKQLIRNNAEAEELYKEVIETLNSFHFDLQEDLSEMLIDHLHSDGSGGERHIAFFSSIASLQELRDPVKLAFEKAYPSCDINILEYHSGMTDAENTRAFNEFVVEEPEDKRIDIMLSVDKATESIHPDNIRSVMMFRGTSSIRVYLQQLGRGIMLKSYHPDDIVIFDLAENVSCMGNQTVYASKQKTADRVQSPVSSASSSSSDGNVQTIDDVKQAIMRRFGYQKGMGLTTKLGLRRIQECIDKLREIERLSDIAKLESGLKYIKRVYDWMIKRGAYSTENIHEMIHNIEQDLSLGDIRLSQIYKGDEQVFKLTWEQIKANFSLYQKLFLSDEVDLGDSLGKLFNSLGHSAYLTPMNRTLPASMLSDIDYVKQEIDKCGSIDNSSNNHAKHKLKQLKLKYAKGSVPHGVCVYARRNNISIESNGMTLQDIVGLCDTDKDKAIVQAYRPVIKAFFNLESTLNDGLPFTYDDWLNAIVKLTVLNRTHRGSEMGIICGNYIIDNFGYISRAYKIPQHDIEQANKLLSALFKIQSGELPNKVEEDYIFRHSQTSDMSEYELRIMSEVGISKRDYIDKVEKHTDFMQKYEKAMQGDEEAIKEMLGYNRGTLDERRKKLLNTTAFRQIKNETKDTLGAEVLLKKAKLMYERDGDYKKTIQEFNEALKSGTVQSIDVALTPFKAHETELAKSVITCSSEEFNSMIESDQVNNLSILVGRCTETASCSRDIIGNILKISHLDSDIKTRLIQLCEQIDIMK